MPPTEEDAREDPLFDDPDDLDYDEDMARLMREVYSAFKSEVSGAVSWLPDHCLRERVLTLQLAGNGMWIRLLSPHSALQAEGARSQQSPFGMRR